MQSDKPTEQPLTPWAKTSLIISTTAVIVLYYMLALLAAFLLLALLAVELVCVIVLLRVGLAAWMISVMQVHLSVVGILFRSLWLASETAEYRITLERSDAPKLFEMLAVLSERFRVRPPSHVQLEMSVNAWVNLKGYRTGAGTTRLGIGYDMLCGLTVSEVEAVVAHEMAHAKLVQRGFKRLANSAIGRCAALVGGLIAFVQKSREAGKGHRLAHGLLVPFDAMVRVLARLVAAFSRQDEFEADRGAADLCGPDAVRSALRKSEAVGAASVRVAWRERVAQLQSGRSYSEWLAKELTGSTVAEAMEGRAVFDKYSTHPTLPDRLAALPPDTGKQRDHSPGLTVFSDPDDIAQRLVDRIQRVCADEESRDSKSLAKWARRITRSVGFTGLQLFSVALFIVAAITGGLSLADGGSSGLFFGVLSLAVLALSIGLYRVGRYKDRRELPVPDYDKLVAAGERKFTFDKQDAMAGEFRALVEGMRSRRRKVGALLDEAYKALAECDYLRAHVAARVCLDEHDKKSSEANLVLAIAGAVFGQGDLCGQALRVVRQNTGFRSKSTAWGASWALMMLGDFGTAEALLLNLVEKHPREITFQCFLALARWRRGKLYSAIDCSRRACEPTPPTSEHALLLIRILLDAGMLREASQWLSVICTQAEPDPPLQAEYIRLNLLTRELDEAERRTERLLATDAAPKRLIQMGHLYQQARQYDRAAGLFGEALKQGHFPEALLGLGQVEAERRNKTQARQRLLEALNLKATLAPEAVGPLQLFHPILATLGSLEDLTHCSAWVATLRASRPQGLSNTSYLVYAPDEAAAQRHLHTVFTAMESGFKPMDLDWKPAPRDEHPVRPVRPGIYRVRFGANGS